VDDCVGAFGDRLRAAVVGEVGAGEAEVGRVREGAMQRSRVLRGQRGDCRLVAG
jgi:hypothetical protein